jgi:hypothetical protein
MIDTKQPTIYCQNNMGKDFQYYLHTIALFLNKNYGYKIQYVMNDQFIKIGDFETTILDCQLLIHYEDIDVIKGICFCDTDSLLSGLFYKRNNINDLFLHSQNGSTLIRFYKERDYKFKFVPINYLPESPMYSSFDNYYLKRLSQKNFKDKMVFRGNVNSMPRESAKLMVGNEYFDGYDYLSVHQYFDSLTEYKVGLSIPGIGEICHRDVEYMAIGLPFIKFEYLTKWEPKLIPNYHYISIDRIGEIDQERYGGEEYSNLYLKRFLEVKDDKEFLNFISKNSRKYYEENLHPLTRLNKIIKIIENE